MAEVKLSGCVDRGSHSLTLPEKAFDAHDAESPAAKALPLARWWRCVGRVGLG